MKLEAFNIPTPVKIGLLWSSLMGLYIYNDYFDLYMPDTIPHMMEGRIGPFDASSEIVMICLSLMLAIPALMIALSSLFIPVISKWLNVILGVLYTLIEIMTFKGSEPYYQIVVVLEIVVTLSIIWFAVTWPKAQSENV